VSVLNLSSIANPSEMGLTCPVSDGRRTVRRDIEGLRAIAVVAVVINHLAPSLLPGGFCGVDIFFVISGYLIGKHLLEDIQAGRFSFLRFYEQRARRLFPALVTVLMAVWIVGWIILSGPEFSALGRHIAASAIFSNNFMLWTESGYFDAPSASKPLLHLWSLGIEEQFYCLVPLLLWFSSRGRRASIRWVVRITVASLLAMELRPVASFYLLDTRFWELGAGVIVGHLELRRVAARAGPQTLGKGAYRELLVVAVVLMFTAVLLYAQMERPRGADGRLRFVGLVSLFLVALIGAQSIGAYGQPRFKNTLKRAYENHGTAITNGVGLVAFAIIVASLIGMTPADWPGPQTLLPVLATAAMLLVGPDSVTSKALSVRPLAFIGGISYPLYLWHWPVIVFWRLLDFPGSAVGGLIPIVIASLLAIGTKILVEDPVRFGEFRQRRARTPPTWAVAVLLLIAGAIGASAAITGGYPSRISPGLRALADWPITNPEAAWRPSRCYFNPGRFDAFAAECTPPKRAATLRVLLWGDSHAAELYPGLLTLQAKANFDVIQLTAAGCPATMTALMSEQRDCADRRVSALHALNRASADVVLISSAWELYLAAGDSEEQILAAIKDDAQWMRRIGISRIVVFGPSPTWRTSLSSDLFRSMRLRRIAKIPDRFAATAQLSWDLDAAMAAQAAALKIEYVSILKTLCDSQGCRTVGDQGALRPDLLFRDRDHLTTSGSDLVMESAEKQVLGVSYFH
jgi:peptidoglycan/LPS O-acetylase OafA/YrhL